MIANEMKLTLFKGCSLFVTCLIFRIEFTESSDLKRLETLGFLPMTGKGWTGGQACLPGILMALRHVNERSGLLDGYNLTYTWVDSQVKMLRCFFLLDLIQYARNVKSIQLKHNRLMALIKLILFYLSILQELYCYFYDICLHDGDYANTYGCKQA